MKWLWGKTGYSLIDVWSIVHLGFWLYFGSLCWSFQHLLKSRWVSFSLCMALALAWEIFERVAEKKWPHLWLTPESWWNAWVSDPLTCVVGVFFIWYALDHWRV